jgi:hypothetical protein
VLKKAQAIRLRYKICCAARDSCSAYRIISVITGPASMEMMLNAGVLD